MFTGKTLLITGGTGTFGNAVLRRFLNTNIKEIRVFSRDEKKQEDMRISLSNSKLKFYIGNVRDPESIAPAMEDVDYVVPPCFAHHGIHANAATGGIPTHNICHHALNPWRFVFSRNFSLVSITPERSRRDRVSLHP